MGVGGDVVSYLPGVLIGWQPEPSIALAGKLLARYHQVSRRITPDQQRPNAVPFDSFGSVGAQRPLAAWIESIAADLNLGRPRERASTGGTRGLHHEQRPHDQQPSRRHGVIDFALAYIEDPLADIGFGLWASGRPRQDAVGMDLDRVARFVAVYVRARGIQQAIMSRPRQY